MRTIIVGSRQSQLALTQTNHVIDALNKICQTHNIKAQFEVKKIVTKGDKILDVTLSKVGGKGLFVKEIEQAMLDKEIDIAVHSMKDMPSELPEGLTIGAVSKREDVRDCIVTRDHTPLSELPKGAVIGTSSLRRASQIKNFRSDFEIKFIRGNIGTRINKLNEGEYDAIVLATAGLNRVGWQDKITEFLSTDLCIPAVGQGALGIECRNDDEFILKLLSYYNDDKTAKTVRAERAFLATLDGSCQIPVAAYAILENVEQNDDILLNGLVGSPDGQNVIKDKIVGRDPEQLGVQLAQTLIDRGANRILEEVRGDH
ncbi:hydroxymethylbilane synthase [Chengkuizengella axinellae]|uniref:Porphobilinogen deaminase n=1 Tax=Chengkuizengella axinellae TaxID=3064388 RepID=A0ABT9ITL7_9BACL|nr:hydroxymethylbilane synthase [Chengkuizengella sp. 2205SS18-9]MDP5272696.1 hydroxymethylbilane synthase [Chengkuizengella sp. 2205SS18-9]